MGEKEAEPRDAETLRWAEGQINRAIALWQDRRPKMARGTDRSCVDALTSVLAGCAAMIGAQAERLEKGGENEEGLRGTGLPGGTEGTVPTVPVGTEAGATDGPDGRDSVPVEGTGQPGANPVGSDKVRDLHPVIL